MNADDVIRLLNLKPHPEGGHFRETFRDHDAKRCWQSARSLGSYSLVGCIVVPGFEHSGRELAPSGWAAG